MRIPRILTIIVSLILLVLILATVYLATRPIRPVIAQAEFGMQTLSPNADGENDITTVSYRLRREATLSIYFEAADGQRYYFRRDETRPRGEYSVMFSGIVEGYTLEGEEIKSEVLSRLLQDGEYTWIIEAIDQATGSTDNVKGKITIVNVDDTLPDLWEFTIAPEVFTPNQDGLEDRVWINAYVPKDAHLTVYLIDQEGKRYFVPEVQEGRKVGEEGRHKFEYDGGVDLGISPPPDGTYTVLIEAEDEEGQHTQRTGQVTIKDGGVPLAEIVGQPVGDTVTFSSETVMMGDELTVLAGDVLTFELTVENYGEAPIRTTGPEPGHIYNQDELYASTGFYVESGAWRVGIHCDTCQTDYPWRWALGTPKNLTPIKDNDGRIHYYLMPGQRAIVSGGIRLTNIVESRNPQQFWAGLIHEDVEIAAINNVVDPHWIRIMLVEALTPTPTP
ncbi:MAG: hypothetical protein JXB30_14365 [Anaerolineae bacterium]|nr:hypothetical protein [Anaerolineae bacterium]